MNKEDIDALNGQLQAISMTLTEVIKTLPRVGAAQAALGLKIAQEERKQHDATDNVPPAEAHMRNMILDAYLGLLSAVARSD